MKNIKRGVYYHILLMIYAHPHSKATNPRLNSLHKIQENNPSAYAFNTITLTHDIADVTWWRHQMEAFSALLAICAGNSPVPGEFPAQRPMSRSFDVFIDLRLNKRLSKPSWGCRAHYDVTVMRGIHMNLQHKTSCHGNVFRITGPLWRETIGHRWFLKRRARIWRFDILVVAVLKKCRTSSRAVGLTWIPAWLNNRMPSKVSDEIT